MRDTATYFHKDVCRFGGGRHSQIQQLFSATVKLSCCLSAKAAWLWRYSGPHWNASRTIDSHGHPEGFRSLPVSRHQQIDVFLLKNTALYHMISWGTFHSIGHSPQDAFYQYRLSFFIGSLSLVKIWIGLILTFGPLTRPVSFALRCTFWCNFMVNVIPALFLWECNDKITGLNTWQPVTVYYYYCFIYLFYLFHDFKNVDTLIFWWDINQTFLS